MSTMALPLRSPLELARIDEAISEEARALARALMPVWMVMRDDPEASASMDLPSTTAVSDFRAQVFDALCRRYQEAQSRTEFRVEPTTYEYAQQFLTMLPSWLPVAPEVFIEQDGEIGFDWDLAARNVLSVSVGRDGTLNYAALCGHKRNHGVDVMADSIPDEILLSFSRLFTATR